MNRIINLFEKFVAIDRTESHVGMEIGCYAGKTTIALLEWMKDAESRIICIDPFLDRYLPEDYPFDQRWAFFKGQKHRFETNTALVRDRLFVHEGFSQDVLPTLQPEWCERLAFAFIDGDHRVDAVYRDAVGVFPLLKPNGYIVFDDYEWGKDLPPEFHTHLGIDRFLREFEDQIEVIIKRRQVVVRKK